ncbi:MAG: hypothetical protein RR334_03720, partial [Clostridia bacterium]
SEAAENTSLGTSGGGYPKRVAEVFYKNGLINLKRTLEKKVWAWSDVKKIVGYEKAISMQEFNQDPMQYICDLLALTNMIKNSIYDAIKNAPPVDNSINAILPNDAYLYNEKDLSYRIKLNGGNLVGDSNVQEILATIYKNNEGYLYKLGASIKVVNIITIKIDDLIIK